MNENVSNIIFADLQKTAIKVFYKDGRIEVKSYNPNDEVVKELLGQITEFDIEVNTHEFNKKETAARRKFEEYLLQKNNPAKTGLKDVVREILENEYSKEELFDLKVEVLELPEITDKTVKTKIRKSKDVLEILSLVYQQRVSNQSTS